MQSRGRVSTHRARGPRGFYSTATREWAGYFSVFFLLLAKTAGDIADWLW